MVESKSTSVVLSNSGNTEMFVSNISISGSNSGDFAILSPGANSFVIPAGSSQEVVVRFSPSSVGWKTAALNISSDSDNLPNKTVTLSGACTEKYDEQVQSIIVSGPSFVNENGKGNFYCIALLSNGERKDITSSVHWSENSGYSSINSVGVLTSQTVNSDQNITITATYSGKSDTHSVTIKNIAATVTSLSISGPTNVDENSSASYSCTATYSDGSTKDVTNSVSWSENSSYSSINSNGVLLSQTVNSDQIVTIAASYSGKSDTHNVTIKNIATTVTSISIFGLTSVDESSSASYSCTANYSDGSTMDITDSVTWSINSEFASISSNGLLTTEAVLFDRGINITANFKGFTDSYRVIIKETLLIINISGAATVQEDSISAYSCTAFYRGDTSFDISKAVNWTVNSDFATISANGILSTSSVDNDTSCTISASYEGKSDAFIVTIENIPTVDSITIEGESDINNNSDTVYTAYAIYSDGSKLDITEIADWSVNCGNNISIDKGKLSVIGNNQINCSISVSYEGVTAEHVINVIITDIDNYQVSENEVRMYPNPTKGEVWIDFEQQIFSPINVTVHSIHGAKVFERRYLPSSQIIIDLSEVVSGMYLVEIVADDWERVEKLVIDKN